MCTCVCLIKCMYSVCRIYRVPLTADRLGIERFLEWRAFRYLHVHTLNIIHTCMLSYTNTYVCVCLLIWSVKNNCFQRVVEYNRENFDPFCRALRNIHVLFKNNIVGVATFVTSHLHFASKSWSFVSRLPSGDKTGKNKTKNVSTRVASGCEKRVWFETT